MHRSTVFAFVGFVSLASLTGCAEGGHGHHSGHGGGGGSSFPSEALATAAVAAAEIAAVAALPAPTPDPDPDPDPYIGAWPAPLPGPMAGSSTDFEPAAALSAIDAVDFGACRSSGTLIGWNHARITFASDGAVTRVAIDGALASGMPPAALECLRAQLASVSAPRFEGPPVTIGAAFFVP